MADHHAAAPDSTARVTLLAPPDFAASRVDDRSSRYNLIRDNDSKYGPTFSGVAKASGIMELRTAYRAPRQNATCERFLGSVRRECLVVLGAGQLQRVLREYAGYFNQHRPHQGMRQQVPDAPAGGTPQREWSGNVRAIPVLGGLHHAYQRAA